MGIRTKTILNAAIMLAGASLVAEPATVQERPAPTQEKPVQTEAEKADLEASAAAADKWLKQVDNGNYHESWEAAALTFKLKIPEESWTTILNTTRKPLGSVTSRKILEQKTAIDPQGLPKGKYMVIFYGTSFATRPNGNELVTLMQLDDGTWKVLTYLVK